MRKLVEWAESLGPSLGGGGLFLVAFLDSSFLSLPQAADVLVMGLVLARKDQLIPYAAMTTMGSLAGSVVLYLVARRGGEAVLRRRVRADRVERALAQVARYGVLAVAVPAVLPPPTPFKLFVLLAGVARVPLGSFALAVGLGRGVRYFGQAWLAAHYGEAALAWMRSHGAQAWAAVAVAMAVAGGLYLIWGHRRRGRPGRGSVTGADRF